MGFSDREDKVGGIGFKEDEDKELELTILYRIKNGYE